MEEIKSGNKFVTRKLDRDEVEDIVVIIQHSHDLEIDFLAKSREECDEEKFTSLLEDAYLANLIKIREAKRLTAEQFIEFEIDKQTCCPYDALEIPKWSDYK